MAMEVDWKGHTLKVSGNWTWRWLFLAPIYELHIDGELIDRSGGPRVRPRLEAIVEDHDGNVHHVGAQLLSILGYKPQCEVWVEDEVIASAKVHVQNFLNPFLVIFIIVATGAIAWFGPAVIAGYLSG